MHICKPRRPIQSSCWLPTPFWRHKNVQTIFNLRLLQFQQKNDSIKSEGLQMLKGILPSKDAMLVDLSVAGATKRCSACLVPAMMMWEMGRQGYDGAYVK
jgi:hypothetical protein